ncbi:PTS fructose transporter subunit IIB [Diplocloster hominis]|uniref:PTS fructose transporter subunit IIB n=1 Tax=Diplocloster hominis TaxID=3079010 RepID=UPI0031BA708E
MKLVIITSCVAGVAHSEMCAAALKKEAIARGHSVRVEMQGGSNLSDMLPKEICQSADVILIAYAIAVAKKERFEGKPVVKVPIGQAIRHIKQVMDKAEEVYEQTIEKDMGD